MNKSDLASALHYLGPKETYTGQVALKVAEKFPETKLTEQVSLEAVARTVVKDGKSIGIMAYYNMLEGLVQESLDLIYENKLNIIGLNRLPIILIAGEHEQNTERTEIYSHPKALAQCSGWLWENYRESRQIATSSTAAAAKNVSEKKSGIAIASKSAIESYGLRIIGEDIGNKRNGASNFTDFYTVTASDTGDERYDKGKEYLTMVAITPHYDSPGLLAEILGQVAYYGINNAKIHSRPAIDDVEIEGIPQMIYLETFAHRDAENFRRCIDSLRYKLSLRKKDAEVVRILGSYEKPV